MNKSNVLRSKIIPGFFIIAFLLSSCEEKITDFGFSGNISGKIVDPEGNIVSGDITVDALTLYIIGEDETEPLRIRVKGDGTYSNTHLYPQIYRIWIQGPIISSNEYTVDLRGAPVIQDFTVTPFLTTPPPVIQGNPSSSEVTVSYNIKENEGKIAESRIIYVSTVPYPSQSTGSGPGFRTISQTVNENQGTVTITGLQSGTTYYVRLTAKAAGTTLWNVSDHVKFVTP